MTTSDPIYVPVLKGRHWEFAALAAVQPVTRQLVLPLIEVVPGPADERAAVKVDVDRTTKKLRTWAGSRLLLDARLLPTDIEVHGGLGTVGYAAVKAREIGVIAAPVISLNDDELAHKDVAKVHADAGGGFAVRMNSEDMDEDTEDIDAALVALLRRLGASRADVDLVLDVGPVEGDLAVRAGSRQVGDFLGGLTRIADWREVIVTAGAFPTDLSSVQPWILGEPMRHDAALWDHLRQRRRLMRVPTYGDYAVAHPLLATGPPFPVAPQLCYTVADRWLTVKGRRNDPRGHEQFYRVCEIIAGHLDFAGAALGNADRRIADGRSYGPGNASTWREIETTHHLDYVVQRLTNLGEP